MRRLLVVAAVIIGCGILMFACANAPHIANYQVGDVLVEQCGEKSEPITYVAALDANAGVVNLGGDTWYHKGGVIYFDGLCGERQIFGRIKAIDSNYVAIEMVR